MADPASKQTAISLVQGPHAVVYANMAAVSQTNHEYTLTFCRVVIQPDGGADGLDADAQPNAIAIVEAEVIMPPTVIEALILALQQQVDARRATGDGSAGDEEQG